MSAPGLFPRSPGADPVPTDMDAARRARRAAQRPPQDRWEPVYPEEWGRALEAAHDAYMDCLRAGVERGDCGDGFDAYGESFCGCDVCERRASWTFLMAWFWDGVETGEVAMEVREWE